MIFLIQCVRKLQSKRPKSVSVCQVSTGNGTVIFFAHVPVKTAEYVLYAKANY